MVTGTTPISQLPTGTIDAMTAVVPMSINMTGTPQTIQASLQQTAQFLKTNLYDGAYLASGTALNPYNYLIDGGFDFAARQSPNEGTLTTYSSTSGSFSADKWKTWIETGTYQYQRQDGLSESGLTSQYFGGFKKTTNTGKMFIYQPVEGNATAALRGKPVIFQVQLKVSSSKTIRMGIFELQNAGTIDVVPKLLITAAGANSTDPTMATNVAIITAAQSKSVTTSMQTFSVSVTVPSNSKNLICAVWSDSQFSSGDILYIAEAGLYASSSLQAWKPRPLQAERSLCQRFCYVTPDGSSAFGETGYWGVANSTSQVTFIIPYAVDMRAAPSFSSSGQLRIDDSATVYAAASLAPTSQSTQRCPVFVNVSGTPLTQFRSYKLSANNDTSAKLIFDAEIG